MTTGKNHRFDYMDLCWQSIISAINTLSRYVIAVPLYCLLVTGCSIYTALHEKWDPKLKRTKILNTYGWCQLRKDKNVPLEVEEAGSSSLPTMKPN